MGDSNIHNHKRVPLVLLGKAGGKLTGGVHIKAPDGTPMANAMFTTLHVLGRTDLQQFGDSSRRARSQHTVGDPHRRQGLGLRVMQRIADDWPFDLRDGRAEPLDADPRRAAPAPPPSSTRR